MACTASSGFSCFKRGDTLLINAKKWDDVAKTTPTVITGYSIRCQGRDADKNLIFECSTGNGITITDGANGEYQIKFANTTAFPTGTLECDIEYTDGSGVIFSTQTFEIEVIEDITHD